MKLIIDPGHGGKDPGGGTNKHWLEKDFALKISLYQYKRFQELGVPVALTRDKDIYLSPEERTKLVRDSGAEYCFSNHINAGGGEGAETIHSIHSNGRLANAILDELVAAGQKKRRVFCRFLPNSPKQDYYFMHRSTGNVETTINEYGFADNENDVKRLLEHWQAYAEAPVKAFCNHINHPYSYSGKEAPEQALNAKKTIIIDDALQYEGFIIDGRTYAPVRSIAQSAGRKVIWNGKNVILK
jgi:N-acetylmuramoyl-L-alanine amidase